MTVPRRCVRSGRPAPAGPRRQPALRAFGAAWAGAGGWAASTAWAAANRATGTRNGEQLTLSVEHRAAASRAGIHLQLKGDDQALALETIRQEPSPSTPPPDLDQRICSALATSAAPLSVAALQKACHVRTATLSALLAQLLRDGRVRRTQDGYLAASPPAAEATM